MLNKKAFSMWEMVITLVVIIVGIYGIIMLIPTLRKSGDRSITSSESSMISKMFEAEIKKDNAILNDNDFINLWDKSTSELIFTPLPILEREIVGIRDMNFRTTVREGMEYFWKVKLNIYSAEQGNEIAEEFIFYVPKDLDIDAS